MELPRQNPQEPTNGQMSARTMYEYDTHKNIPWNMQEYQPVRQFIDPIKQMRERKFVEQKKMEKDTRYQTRRGFYMDYHIKVVKELPPPSMYQFADQWKLTDMEKKKSQRRKIDSSLGKYTYLDRISMEEKNRSKPAPGAYNLCKTDKEIKEENQKLKSRKRSVGPKRYFFEENEYLSNLTPGMGSHNPHDNNIPHLRINKTDHKFWTKKHDIKAKSERKKGFSQTSPCHYTAMALEYSTFDRIKTADESRRKKKKETTNGFGTDSKFTYDRPAKKKIIEKRPDPGAHDVFISWKGKSDESRTKGWLRSRSTGFSHSVYN